MVLKEVARKLIHLCWILILIGFMYFEKTGYEKLFLVSILVIVLFIDLLRLDFNVKFGFEKLLRKHEQKQIFTPTLTVLSTAIALMAFDKPIAIAAVSMMVFTDTLTAIVDKTIGKTIFYHRSVEGIILGLILNLIICYLLLNNWIIIISMAITASVFELITYKLNDNLTVPIFAGFVGQLLYLIL